MITSYCFAIIVIHVQQARKYYWHQMALLIYILNITESYDLSGYRLVSAFATGYKAEAVRSFGSCKMRGSPSFGAMDACKFIQWKRAHLEQ